MTCGKRLTNFFNDKFGCPQSGPSPTLISMADQPSSTAVKKSKKKGGGIIKKLFRDLIKRSQSVDDLASQFKLNSTRAHNPVPGNDAGSAEPMASSKYIGSIFMLSTTTWPFSR